MPVEEIARLTHIDPWFLDQMLEILEREREVREYGSLEALPDDVFREAKRDGFSDANSPRCSAATSGPCARSASGVACDRSTSWSTPARRSSTRSRRTTTPRTRTRTRSSSADKPRIVILGGGPNRIGQGIEFDYCCCHAAFALSEIGIETVMVNSNPETVSTDYDTSDMLFFEPLTVEDVLHVIRARGADRRDRPVRRADARSTSPTRSSARGRADPRHIASTRSTAPSDRERFQALLKELGIQQPLNGTATSVEDAVAEAAGIGYPCVVRPSYVLGGRGMETVYDEEQLRRYMAARGRGVPRPPGPARPLHGGGDRARRGRRRGRRAGRDRRHPRAHRGGGHPLRRLRLLASRATRLPSGRARRSCAITPSASGRRSTCAA